MSDVFNPNIVRLDQAFLTKYNGTDRQNIMPQIVEFVLYQSIFQTLLRADIVISDFVGLMNNYPLTGEEIVEVVLTQQDQQPKTVQFVINAIREITISDDARSMGYVMELISYPAFVNAKTRVSKAYEPKPAEDIISDIIQKFLKENLVFRIDLFNKRFLPLVKTRNVGSTSQRQALVIPNLKPLDAIAWLCQYAIATGATNQGPQVIQDVDKYYTPIFFETLDDFRFKALQQITYKDIVDEEQAISKINTKTEMYAYFANIGSIRNNQQQYEQFLKLGYNETRLISDIKINKRYSGLEKVVGGYFENELIEINPIQQSYEVTYTAIKEKGVGVIKSLSGGERRIEFNTVNPGRDYHTETYIEDAKNNFTNEETSARLHYITNTFDGISFRDKFGFSSRSFLAFQQLDISILVPADLTLKPGDYMYVEFPEFHGFNVNDKDKYISGTYLISEIKNIFRQGGKSQMYLRLNRDSFNSTEGMDVPSSFKQ